MSPTDHRLAHTYLGVAAGPPWAHPQTIVAHLMDRVVRDGDAAFLTTVAADGSTAMLSARELDVRSRRLSCWLHHELGVRGGDVVGVLPRNDIDSVVAIFSVLRRGAAVLVLSPTDPVGRLRQQIAALGAAVTLRGPAVPADVLPEATGVPDVDTLSAALDALDDAVLDPAADALFFGTSGSTAAAKLVAQSHGNIVANAAAVRRRHHLRPGDRVLGCLPIHHVNGLHFTVLDTLAAGAHTILAHAFKAFDYPQLLERFRPRIASVVPSVLEALLETWRSPESPAGAGLYFVSAAAPLSTGTTTALSRQLGVRVCQGYGLTETTNFSTTLPADLSPAAYQRLMIDTEIPSVGTAMHGNEVAVLRPDATPAATGEIGEVCMRGHNVMSRYAGNPDATDEAFRHGWFHSQDLGYQLAEEETGQLFLVLTGRIKNIAKVGGESISLDEMERALRAIPGILDAACVAVPHRFLGDEIVTAVVFGSGQRSDVLAHLRGVFAAAALPRRIVELDAIPRTATGKILRPQLAERLTSP